MNQRLWWPGSPDSIVEIRDPNEHIQKNWVQNAYYESGHNGLLRHISKRFTDNAGLRYVDVGASIGNHTLFFLKVMGAWYVTAIEPIPASMDHLLDNLRLNSIGTDRCRVLQWACAAEYGAVRMGRYHESNNVGMWMVGGEADQVDVDADTLDNLLYKSGRVDILKIDVECYNRQVLSGAKKTLQEQRAVIYIECEDDLDWVDGFLSGFGYDRTPDLKLCHTPVYEYIKS